jgi:E3 ubiquitin-protein ligase BIG BROTHER-like protein
MLDEDVVKRGVSERKLRSLPVRSVTRHKAGDEKCNICQFEYRDGEKAMHLPCRHQFHPDCIKEWFKENRTCPVCRYEVEA